jgi:hypothetical protein
MTNVQMFKDNFKTEKRNWSRIQEGGLIPAQTGRLVKFSVCSSNLALNHGDVSGRGWMFQIRFISKCHGVFTRWQNPYDNITRKSTSHIHNTHITYTQIHISHKITPLKTNKQNKEKQICSQRYTNSQWLQHRKMRRNKAIPDTGLGGLLSCVTSSLSHCLHNRFTVGGYWYYTITSNNNEISTVRNCCTCTTQWLSILSTSLTLHILHFHTTIYPSLTNFISLYFTSHRITSVHFTSLHIYDLNHTFISPDVLHS